MPNVPHVLSSSTLLEMSCLRMMLINDANGILAPTMRYITFLSRLTISLLSSSWSLSYNEAKISRIRHENNNFKPARSPSNQTVTRQPISFSTSNLLLASLKISGPDEHLEHAITSTLGSRDKAPPAARRFPTLRKAEEGTTWIHSTMISPC